MYFVTFDLAKKLKEKGFTCKYPFAMYNELGSYCPLTTSSDYVTCESGYKCRCYYDYNDFDENDFIAPTISQVLKWLREEENIHIQIGYRPNTLWRIVVIYTNIYIGAVHTSSKYNSYEEAAIAGIEYVLDNLI